MTRRWLDAVHGHFWTIAPVAESLLRPPQLRAGQPWHTTLHDDTVGSVRLSGQLHAPARPTRTLLVALHGLAGDIESHYIRRVAAAANAAGIACLRLNMRGADLSGDDYYHAGLTTDLRATLASAALDRFDRLLFVGYSIGGHIMLRYATEECDARLMAVAAVCPPLDLAQAVRDIDAAARWPYRRYVLSSLKPMLRAIHRRRRSLPIPLSDALSIAHLARWDEDLIAPRFGFRGAGDYHERMSVGPRLGALRVPSLVLGARHDPMVPMRSIERAIGSAPADRLTVRWLAHGGHVGFPGALETQVVEWLLSR